MQQAWATVDPEGQHGREVWHLLRTCSQVQRRVDRVVATLEAQAATAQRYAERVAAGERPRGRQPRALDAAHAVQLTTARRTAQALRYLTGELHSLLEVVVLRPTGVLDAAVRQAELDALLRLLAEVQEAAAPFTGRFFRSGHRSGLPDAVSVVPGVVEFQARARAARVGAAAAAAR